MNVTLYLADRLVAMHDHEQLAICRNESVRR